MVCFYFLGFFPLPFPHRKKRKKEKKKQGLNVTISKRQHSSRHSREYYDAPKVFARSHQSSDDDDSARAAVLSSSKALSILFIPSLKEVSTCQVIWCIRIHPLVWCSDAVCFHSMNTSAYIFSMFMKWPLVKHGFNPQCFTSHGCQCI